MIKPLNFHPTNPAANRMLEEYRTGVLYRLLLKYNKTLDQVKDTDYIISDLMDDMNLGVGAGMWFTILPDFIKQTRVK